MSLPSRLKAIRALRPVNGSKKHGEKGAGHMWRLHPSSMGTEDATNGRNQRLRRSDDRPNHFPIRALTDTRTACWMDDMVIKGPTGQSFFLRITRPSAKAAVIWLEEKKLREKWWDGVHAAVCQAA